uniref:Poly-gamma-glutamate system protein n=1 Tax=Candidatus Kentrum sp. FM TaxID=2126340 RepID=A0A450TVS3_9GAMM|nr:MAG: poly-gamma-glutamate system protein [Candidatus Kentron sp. FM]VFJ73846.1 MAG: poly-gamma-glutamate system protein [Candidatus Kentron sp. FM]
MKKLYWKSCELDWRVDLFIAMIAALGLVCIQHFKVFVPAPHYEEKLAAANLMKKGMNVIDHYRKAHIDDKYADNEHAGHDPVKIAGDTDDKKPKMESGLLGIPFSPITSIISPREYKQITINPNWAAVMVDFYREAGLEKGDTIAAGFSGSFPALNFATLAAAEVMGLRVIAINSVAASGYGGNIPEFSWPDINRVLNEEGILSTHSVAASMGAGQDIGLGVQDVGRNIEKDGIQIIKDIIGRNHLEFIYEVDSQRNIERRMGIYEKYAGDNDIEAYVNVGGGIISVGGLRNSRKIFKPGLNVLAKPDVDFDSIMVRFAERAVPVIHIRHIRELCKSANMPCELHEIPPPGEGIIFGAHEYNYVLTVAVLIGICLLLLVLIKTEYANIIFLSNKSKSTLPAEPMV